jgi:hypothetical protein
MSNMFRAPTPPPTPTPLPPPTMPDPFGAASLEASRTAMAKASQGGRSSTILTTANSRGANTIAAGGGGVPYSGARTGS